jgi:nitroreductase
MVRSFSGAPLPPGVLDTILDLAVRAPSAGNTGGLAFVILEGPGETERYWNATTTAEWRETSRRYPAMARAPIVVVVLASPTLYMERYAEKDKALSGLGPIDGEAAWPVPYWFFDAGASVMSMLLGATDAGLGACVVGNFRGEKQLLDVLGVDGSWRFAGAVLLGEPGGSDPKSASLSRDRSPISEIVHRGSWTGR